MKLGLFCNIGHEARRDILSKMADRMGVFGGTFDPPHLGHLILAAEAQSQLKLDKVLWVLTAIPPHKQSNALSALQDRKSMVQLAINEDPAFELSTVDMERPGPQYSVDTVRLLRERHPDSKIIMILGGDSLEALPKWNRPQQLVEECDEIGVVRRPADNMDLGGLENMLPGIGAKIQFVNAPLLEIASHDIRERVMRRLPYRYYLPSSVYDYIRSRGLYTTG